MVFKVIKNDYNSKNIYYLLAPVTATTKGQGNWLLGAAILASTYKDCKGFSNLILKHYRLDHTKGQGGGEELVIIMDFNYLVRYY